MVAVLDFTGDHWWKSACSYEQLREEHHLDEMKNSIINMNNPSSSSIDYFDQLPDSLLILILNKVCDIKALGRCCAVSKRFHSLAALVENVVVKVDCVISGDDGNLASKSKGLLGHLVRLVFGGIVKPLQLLQHILSPKKNMAEVSHHSPSEVLRSFREIKNLRIELPSGELGTEEGVLLKWKAVFGSTLESCVILGVASVEDNDDDDGGKSGMKKPAVFGELCHVSSSETNEASDGGCIPDSFYTGGELKKRVVWTISSLIAASARHYLLQQIISDHLTLETLVLTDADGQGMLCMGKKQLLEFRDKPVAACASSSRTQVPDLNMKLWYAPSMSLSGGGCAMKGATLVAIRPSHQQAFPKEDDDEFISKAFGEPFKSVACSLARRRTYLLEMNSF